MKKLEEQDIVEKVANQPTPNISNSRYPEGKRRYKIMCRHVRSKPGN